MAVDLLLRFLRNLPAATGELELGRLHEAKRHADLDRTRLSGPQELVLGPAERLLPEEGLARVHVESGPHEQEAIIGDRRVRLERRGRRLSATTPRFPATLAVSGRPVGRSRKCPLYRLDRSRDGVQADRTGRGMAKEKRNFERIVISKMCEDIIFEF